MAKKETSSSYFRDNFGKKEDSGKQDGAEDSGADKKKTGTDHNKDGFKRRSSDAGASKPRRDDAGSYERKPRFDKDAPREDRKRGEGDFKPRRDDGGSYERKPRFDKDAPREDRKRGEGDFKPRRDDGGSYERKPRFDKDAPREDRKRGEGDFKPRRDDGGSYERKPRFDKDAPREDRKRGEGDFKPRRDDGGSYERKPRFDKDAPREDRKRGEGDFKPRRDDGGSYERKPRFDKDAPREDRKPRRDFDDKKSFDGPKRDKPDFEALDENGERVKRPRKPKSDEPDLSNFKAPKGIVGKEFPKKIGGKKPGTKIEVDEEEDMEGDGLLPAPPQPEQMPLNKYIAHCGLSSRRDAVEYIKQGKVRVNGELITEPGYKVRPEDTVIVAGKKILPQKNLAYILLNKPKGFITTTDDEKDRDTVMQLVAASGVERLYPVGRLDRNTTGLLLLTNDGDLAQKLSHPKYMVRKVYQVSLDRSLATPDFQKIMSGNLSLDDGPIQVDALAYLDARNELGIEIHSGRNRVVRRIFESLGYTVEKLDRVMYAGLTKKNLPRGKWRMLSEHEVILLKHFKSNK